MSNSRPEHKGAKRLSQSIRVVRRQRKGSRTELKLVGGLVVDVLPFSPVGEGDEIVMSRGKAVATVTEGGNKLPLRPVWKQRYRLRIGRQRLVLTVKEVETDAELEALSDLKRFHYRGEQTAGRAVPLIATLSHPLSPGVVGFIEITSALLVNSARRPVIDRPFSDSTLGVRWQRWDMKTAKRNMKRFARISRCVVYPELRGLGLAARLVDAAVGYTSQRWQFGGARPLFLEITADMLRYSPFVTSAGFTYVGETEGNELRMVRDMNYLLRRTLASGTNDDFPKGGGGIMSLQRSYASMLLSVMNRKKMGLEKLLTVLRKTPERLSDDDWIALHRVFRRPKPTYMKGLTAEADAHVKRFAPKSTRSLRAKMQTASAPKRSSGVTQDGVLLEISGLSMEAHSSLSNSPRSRKVAESFGIVAKQLESPLFRELNLTVRHGQVVLIYGPSGAGKSLLLRTIGDAWNARSTASEFVQHGSISVRGRRAWAESPKSKLSPVDIFSESTLETALALMADAGLAEASLFVRTAESLSEGQRYRLGIAKAFESSPDVILIDAFCEPLDELSAAAVCKKLRTRADIERVAVVVATAAPERVRDLLQPDIIVKLLPGRKAVVLSIDRGREAK